jgi:Fe-S cluster assembly iron-binding protein IscA
MINVSERAAQKLKDLLGCRGIDIGLGFRVAHDGHMLVMEVAQERQGDIVVKAHGMKILVDTATAELLGDFELDYLGGPACSFHHKGDKRKHAHLYKK